jgi:hypothetical protein
MHRTTTSILIDLDAKDYWLLSPRTPGVSTDYDLPAGFGDFHMARTLDRITINPAIMNGQPLHSRDALDCPQSPRGCSFVSGPKRAEARQVIGRCFLRDSLAHPRPRRARMSKGLFYVSSCHAGATCGPPETLEEDFFDRPCKSARGAVPRRGLTHWAASADGSDISTANFAPLPDTLPTDTAYASGCPKPRPVAVVPWSLHRPVLHWRFDREIGSSASKFTLSLTRRYHVSAPSTAGATVSPGKRTPASQSSLDVAVPGRLSRNCGRRMTRLSSHVNWQVWAKSGRGPRIF